MIGKTERVVLSDILSILLNKRKGLSHAFALPFFARSQWMNLQDKAKQRGERFLFISFSK